MVVLCCHSNMAVSTFNANAKFRHAALDQSSNTLLILESFFKSNEVTDNDFEALYRTIDNVVKRLSLYVSSRNKRISIPC